MSGSNAANWALGKRCFHWLLASAVVVALVSPKPGDGGGMVHIMAGTSALALVLLRVGWRALGDIRPHVKGAWRLKAPAVDRGPRGFAPLLSQSARLGGFLFLALIPLAVALALLGIGQGEESFFLEAHETAGTAIMAMAIGHAAAAVTFAFIVKYDLIGVTLSGGANSVLEGGARGVAGMILGVAAGLSALAYIWGPFDVASKAAALSEQGSADGHEGRDDD